jgi:GNAT superfamily N-acetyltransferase
LALRDVKRRVTGCFVAVDETGDLCGYYILAATHVPTDALPPETTKKLPPYPVIPAMLIGRLAVATKYRGRGLGQALVADAAMRTNSFGIGVFALIVDAKDETATAFYRANGFLPIPDETRRLFLPMATALQLMGEKPDTSAQR